MYDFFNNKYTACILVENTYNVGYWGLWAALTWRLFGQLASVLTIGCFDLLL